ncbi:MAG: hypothetical protein UZ22_OP11002000820 [Microgenomates bacterium OLB23]|nr:MAG: hypothetical protein UZ22_OP11002000820 [Microgenomates bacterium OLB23]
MKNSTNNYIKVGLTNELKTEIRKKAETLIIRDVDEIMKALRQVKMKKAFTMLNVPEKRPARY